MLTTCIQYQHLQTQWVIALQNLSTNYKLTLAALTIGSLVNIPAIQTFEVLENSNIGTSVIE